MSSSTQPYLKPIPDRTPRNREFWDALREHRFLLPRCRDCGRHSWIPYPACRNCLSEDLEWVEASGNATVYSFTLVHRGAGPFQEEAPYALVAAALAEDPKHCVLLANTVDIPNEELRIGMPVRIAFEDIEGEDTTLWRVGPA